MNWQKVKTWRKSKENRKVQNRTFFVIIFIGGDVMITYSSVDIKDIKRIESMWQQLISYLGEQSENNRKEFVNKEFSERMSPVLDKARSGKYRLLIANDGNLDIGYCLSTITKDGVGEVDSIFIDNEFRKLGIGEYLMEDALQFFDQNNTRKDILSVSEGNEDVMKFYKKFGFRIRYYVMKRMK